MARLSGNAFESINAQHNATAAIFGRRFCVLVSDEVVLATGGGEIDGVTVNDVATAGFACSYFEDGEVPVDVGTAGVTADHDVMVETTTGMAVDATPGGKVVGKSRETVASGGIARVTLQDRPHLLFGNDTGATGGQGVLSLTLSGAAIHAGVVGLVSPFSVPVVVNRPFAYVVTPATGACKLDVGTNSTSIATASDNLMDGIDVNTAAGVFSVTDGDGTNGKGTQVWAVGKWITVKEISGDATGLVGKLLIPYTLTA